MDAEKTTDVVVKGVRLEVFTDLSRQRGRILWVASDGDYTYGVFGAVGNEVLSRSSTGKKAS
jgi:hypothetical protein